MAAGFETLDPDSMVEITPVVKDGSTIVSHGTPFRMTLSDFGAYLASGGAIPVATTTVKGVVNQAAAQADFVGADVTALKVELNAFLAKLEAAGIVAP